MSEKKSGQEGSSHNVPALNKFMHSRNIYRTPPSFKLLASLYPNFRQFCSYDVGSKVHLDFTNPQALSELAVTLLHKDFGLTVHLPVTHLVPTIPLRLNYLLWMQDIVNLWADRIKPREFDLKEELLLQQQQKQQCEKVQLKEEEEEECSQSAHKQKPSKEQHYIKPVIGFDIGCGASCVYGLLGVRQCNFHMVASDTDVEAVSAARDNVVNNALDQQVFVVQGREDSLFSALQQPDTRRFLASVQRRSLQVPASGDEPMDVDGCCGNGEEDASGYLLDFSMCNPPFFSSEQEADSCSKTKKDRPPPNNAYTGRPQETVVEGGEVAFISRMIQESSLYKDKIRVFSTLVGTAADVKLVKQALAAVAPAHKTVTEFCQGRTMRWGVAWSWCNSISLETVKSKKQSSSVKPLLLNWPRASCLSVYTVPGAWEAIESWLREIKLKPKVFKTSKYFVGAALKVYKATWQHQRQRRREEKRKQLQSDHSEGVCSPDSAMCEANTSGASDSSEPGVGVSEDGISRNGAADSKRRLSNSIEDQIENFDGSDTKRRKLEPDGDAEGSSEEDNATAEPEDHSNERTNNGVATLNQVKQTGKPCLLKVNMFVKLVNNQLIVEVHTLGGLMGREGANQLLTYFRNRLQRR